MVAGSAWLITRARALESRVLTGKDGTMVGRRWKTSLEQPPLFVLAGKDATMVGRLKIAPPDEKQLRSVCPAVMPVWSKMAWQLLGAHNVTTPSLPPCSTENALW